MKEGLTRKLTVYRRETINFFLTFERPLPAQWEELQLVFKTEDGSQRLSKFVKQADARPVDDVEGHAKYAITFTIDGIDPVGTFTLQEGAVRLHDGFIMRWNPDTENGKTFTLVVDYTPEHIVAIDAVAQEHPG